MKKLGLMLILSLALPQTQSAFALENSQEIPIESGQSPTEEKEAEPAFDPEDAPPLPIRITDRLFFGAKLDVKLDGRDNEDLTDEEADEEARFEAGLSPAILYNPLKNVDLYAEGDFSQSIQLQDSADQEEGGTDADLDRAYMLWRNFLYPSLDVQVGRQRLKDKREWFYDDDLDAIRIEFDRDPFSLELSASTNMIDPEDSEDRIRNYILNTTYRYGKKNKISFRGILRRDSSREDFNPTFFGISWRDKKSIKRQEFWLNSALLLGREESKRLRGFGVDLGWISKFKYPMKPALTIGFAYGSGDSNPETGVDKNFRQTGLQDNNGKFTGNTKFRYYGEVFDPELSNMMIWTTGLGIRPFKKSSLFKKTSLDVVYHYYAQAQKSIELRDADIDADPSGESRNLGYEVDLILGTRIGKKFRIALTTGVFMPGSAFPEGDSAFFGELKMEFTF